MVMSSATGNPTGLVFPHDLTLAGGSTDGQTPTAGLSPFGGTPNPNFVVNFPAPVGTGRGGAIGLSMGSLSGNVNFSDELHTVFGREYRVIKIENNEGSYVGPVTAKVVPELKG